MTCSTRNLDRTRGSYVRIHPRMVECTTPRPLEAVGLPKCNNADTVWYVRMPTDQLLVDPKVENLLGQCMEDTTLEATVPMTDNQLPHCTGVRVILWFSVRLNIRQASLERKGDTVLL